MAELVEHRRAVKESRRLVPGQVKPMTYTIDICRFLTWHSELLALDKDWLTQCPDNVTEWDIGSRCQQPDFRFPHGAALLSRNEHALVQVGTDPDMTISAMQPTNQRFQVICSTTAR